MNRMIHALTLTFLLLFAASPSAHADKVDDFVATQMQRQHIPGLSIAVVKNGKLVTIRAARTFSAPARSPARQSSSLGTKPERKS